jgi:hypothetical protein
MEPNQGGCHCAAVRFEMTADIEPIVMCNCSICTKKGYLHRIVPKDAFKLLRGEESLACYTFGTKVARHIFCKHCGVAAFYIPRSHPDCIDVNVRCLDKFDPAVHLPSVHFDGKHWENAVETLKEKLSTS